MDPTMGRVTFEGIFDITRVDGNEVSRNGGEHALAVPAAGWRNVNVGLDIAIEALLVLLPPGCASASEECALVQPFPAQAADGDRWLVPAMEPGTWTVRLESNEENDQLYRSGRYTVTLDYLEN